MRAIYIDDYGDEDVVRYGEIAVPKPGPGDVRIRLALAGINFMDVHTRQGKYRSSQTYKVSVPTTLGMEGGGVIDALGSGVTDLVLGQRVVYCLSWGSYADFAVVPADRIVPVPDDLSLEQAVAALFHGLTAHYHDVGQLAPGRTCLIHAASGGIGQILVQMGVAAGATVLATTSTEAKREVVMGHGAAACFGYDGFSQAVREATGDAGVDVVFDAIGKPTFRESLTALRKKGLMVAYGSVGGNVKDLDPIELGEAGSLFLTRPRLADHIAGAEAIRERAGAVFDLLLDGRLTITPAGEVEFDEVLTAHRALEARTVVGKPLLRVSKDVR